MALRTARSALWPACFTLVLASAFFLSGMQPPPLELDPSWQAALEYATAHHFQYGTQIVFTFGPLGFLDTRTSLGLLLAARIAFAFFWGALVALAATAVAKRLPGWVRYAFLAWLVVFTLSGGLDQTAFFALAYGTIVLIHDHPKQRWQAPCFILAFIVLSLIKLSFLTAALASLALVVICWIGQRKIARAAVLALAAPAGFIACWMALGQSPAHLGPWLRHAVELQSGYSAAMNLVPKTPVLAAALTALALFVAALAATAAGARRSLATGMVLLTLAQYGFLAWKEGFTRSGDWHAYVFLWFLPLGVALCFLVEPSSRIAALRRWGIEGAFAISMVLCLAGAHFQIPGYARRQVIDWPRRVAHNAEAMLAIFRGRADSLYAGSRAVRHAPMLQLERAQELVGNEPVDVMNYLLLAAVVNGMNYRPRPVIQGFVAYTPALQKLNREYFQSPGRPRFVLLCQQATDGRFPTTEDSAAVNYVLNNYVPVARDGQFLILEQRGAEVPALRLVHEQTLRFGEKLDLRPWTRGPLFMSVQITPSRLGRAVTLLYQPSPLSMRVAEGASAVRYRIVPSTAELPFLLNPVLDSNYDVLNFYASRPGKQVENVTFERPATGTWEFVDHFTVRLYGAPDFPRAARAIPSARMLADVQGRVFWPEPARVASAAPARLVIRRGTPALMVRAPSKITVEIPPDASSFTGYFGRLPEAYGGNGRTPGVRVSVTIVDRRGRSRVAFDDLLGPSSRADEHGLFNFRVPIDGARDRSIILTTSPGARARGEGGWSVWSQCRFDP